MPSLSALNEFKTSFHNIANERNDLFSREMPFDDLVLPDKEPEPLESFEPPAAEDSPGAVPSDTSASDGNFNFGAFLNNLPEDVNPIPVDDHDESLPALDDIFQVKDSPPPETQPPPGDEIPVFDDSLLSEDGQQKTEDDYGLPDSLLSDQPIESAPVDFEPESENLGTDTFDLGGEDISSEMPDFNIPEPEPEIGNAFDLGGERQDGSFSMGTDDIPQDDFSSTGGIESFDETPGGDFDLGSGLSGLDFPAAEGESGIESEGSLPDLDFPAAEGESGIESEGSLPDLDFPSAEGESGIESEGSLPDLDFPSAEGESSFESEGSLPDLDFPSAEGESDFDSGGSLPDFDFPATEGESDFDSGGSLPDFDFPATEGESDFDSGGSLPDFDFPATEEESGFDLGGSSAEGGFPAVEDGSEIIDISSEFTSESIELENDKGAETAGALGDSDFSLPALDEMFDKTKIDKIINPTASKSLFKRKKKKEKKVQVSDDTEEINLSQEDLNNLLKTLSRYPLNLRIVCEELIAEKVLEPHQLAKLVRLLVTGASVKETAAHAEEITGKPVVIPKSFEKSTGAALEAEQSSFAYIFKNNFLPVFRLFAIIGALAASVFYLGYRFIYTPIKAESLYKRGYERIAEGEYQRANELFREAFSTYRKKNWFYKYAEGFRDVRRYLLSEAKYDELLSYYPRDKKGVLDYAYLNTYYLMNYEKADKLLRQQLLDYTPNDYDALLAAGDNYFAWADSNPSAFSGKYEDARFAYARILDLYGWTPSVVERMLMYFIRTDNLKEVLPLRAWFESGKNRKLSPASSSELAGYLLDKQLEEVKGVPNPYVESIENVRDMLIQAVREDPNLPEPHYHLARYYKSRGNIYEERKTLENAIAAFNYAKEESVRRRIYRVDTHYRYANLLINNKEFFPAEEQLVLGINLYEDYLSRNLLGESQQLGRLYCARGDLEYFVKLGDMQTALKYYHVSEKNGWSPPEIQYRMGAAYYQLEDWKNALEYLFKASVDLPLNRRMLFSLGNAAYKRGDYFAAEGYYTRLLNILENQRSRLPVLLPNDRPDYLELGERLMMARNNAGVNYEALADSTGTRNYRSRAMILYAESARAWDSITRNPVSMERMRLTDSPGAPGINLGYLNANNALHPENRFNPEIFIRIDKDVFEPSRWDELAPFGGLQH
jgi:tetratricopeptide (TPR) repeat protein